MAHVVSLFLFLPIFHLFSFFIISHWCLISHHVWLIIFWHFPIKYKKMMYVNLLICLWIDKGIQCKYDLFLTLYLGMVCSNKMPKKVHNFLFFQKKCRKFFSTMKNCISYYILMPFNNSQRYVIFNGKKSKNYPVDNEKINNKEVSKK